EELSPDAEASELGQEVHLSELGDISVCGFRVAEGEGRETAATNDVLSVARNHPIGRSRRVVRAVHVVDFGIEDREAWTSCAELGHHRADQPRDRLAVARPDEANRVAGGAT